MDKVWGYHGEATSRTLDTHVRRLREKLGEEGAAVETVRGVGYRMENPDGRLEHDISAALPPDRLELSSSYALVSFILAFLLTGFSMTRIDRSPSHVVFTFIFGYGVRVLIARPLHEIAVVPESWLRANLDQRLPITGDEEIASLGTSLNTMANHLGLQIQELFEGKQRLEHILEAMGQGVMVFDRTGRLTLTNSSILRILGTDRDLGGRTPLEIFRRPELGNAIQDVVRGAGGTSWRSPQAAESSRPMSRRCPALPRAPSNRSSWCSMI